jgi:hypothetical protein
MPFQWDVQPYQFLSELRAQYTRTTILATRGKAREMAAEAEAWMKENAPWQDRSVQERVNALYKKKSFTNRPVAPDNIYMKGARAGLKAYVVAERSESALYAAGMAEARNADALLLDDLNAVRKEKREAAERKARASRQTTQGKLDAARRARKMPTNRRLSKVPVGQSAVKGFEKAWNGMRSPVCDVKFSHEEELDYAIWLEIANGGRYGIISRALYYWQPKFFREVKRIANLVQYRDSIMAGMTIGETTSPAEQFAAHIQEYESFFDKPYKPWSAESKANRKSRRKYYNPESARQTRAMNKAYNQSQTSSIGKQVISRAVKRR